METTQFMIIIYMRDHMQECSVGASSCPGMCFYMVGGFIRERQRYEPSSVNLRYRSKYIRGLVRETGIGEVARTYVREASQRSHA